MIVKVAKSGAKAGRLINYSFGPGHGNEHMNPHTIAGSVHYPGADRATIKQIITDLELHQKLWPDVAVPGGHVWHASLSLSAAEGAIPEAKWAAIAADYMKEMGFDVPGKAGVQWTAIHHGTSVKDNDHIHIVASRIRQDGTKVSNWQDMPRSQRAALKLEQTHGLQVLASRTSTLGAGSVPYTGGEAGKSRDSGLPIERVDIERRVRAALAASSSETEFVRRVKADGLVVRPFPDKGAVTGWSIGVPTDGKPTYFTGGKIARDLTLPKIREQLGAGAGNADAEWRGGPGGQPALVGAPGGPQVAVAPDLVAAVHEQLVSLGQQLGNATPEQYAELSADIAGALAATSVAVEGSELGELAGASREVGAWSQTRRSHGSRSRQRHPAVRGLALLMLQAQDPTGPLGQSIMVRQLMEAVMSLHRLHRASRSVAVGSGRSIMAEPDGIDQAAGEVTTMTITATAIGVSAWAERHRTKKENGVTGRRFTLLRAADPGDPRATLPKGLQGVISADEWAGMDNAQRHMVDPNRLGRWPTDYVEGTPGATLPSSTDQWERVDVAARAAGRDAPDVQAMTRGGAADVLRRLEAQAGPGAMKEAYLDAGLVHRQTVQTKDGSAYELVFPGAQGAVPTATAPDPTPVVAQPVVTFSGQSKAPDDPMQWKTAMDPVTAPQARKLVAYGFTNDDLQHLRKGSASAVLDSIKKNIDKDGMGDHAAVDATYKRVAAVVMRTPPVMGQQVPPAAPDAGGHSR